MPPPGTSDMPNDIIRDFFSDEAKHNNNSPEPLAERLNISLNKLYDSNYNKRFLSDAFLKNYSIEDNTNSINDEALKTEFINKFEKELDEIKAKIFDYKTWLEISQRLHQDYKTFVDTQEKDTNGKTPKNFFGGWPSGIGGSPGETLEKGTSFFTPRKMKAPLAITETTDDHLLGLRRSRSQTNPGQGLLVLSRKKESSGHGFLKTLFNCDNNDGEFVQLMQKTGGIQKEIDADILVLDELSTKFMKQDNANGIIDTITLQKNWLEDLKKLFESTKDKIPVEDIKVKCVGLFKSIEINFERINKAISQELELLDAHQKSLEQRIKSFLTDIHVKTDFDFLLFCYDFKVSENNHSPIGTFAAKVVEQFTKTLGEDKQYDLLNRILKLLEFFNHVRATYHRLTKLQENTITSRERTLSNQYILAMRQPKKLEEVLKNGVVAIDDEQDNLNINAKSLYENLTNMVTATDEAIKSLRNCIRTQLSKDKSLTTNKKIELTSIKNEIKESQKIFRKLNTTYTNMQSLKTSQSMPNLCTIDETSPAHSPAPLPEDSTAGSPSLTISSPR